jgi:hypothetical protein
MTPVNATKSPIIATCFRYRIVDLLPGGVLTSFFHRASDNAHAKGKGIAKATVDQKPP